VDSGPPPGPGAVDDPLLFIHGITATQAYWRQNLPHFAPRRRVIALDLPGFGRSDRPDIDYKMEGFVDLVRALLDARGIGAATLIGNSMGGLVLMLFALEHPIRVCCLVLVDPAGVSLWPRRLMLSGLALGRLGVRAARAAMGESAMDAPRALPALPALVVRTLFSNVFPRSSALAQRFTRSYIDSVHSDDFPLHLRAAVRAATSILSLPMRQRCQQIAAPTLIMWGALDRLVPVGDGKALRKRIAGSRLVIYSHSGHCPMLDQPERWNHDVEAFLDGKPVGR